MKTLLLNIISLVVIGYCLIHGYVILDYTNRRINVPVNLIEEQTLFGEHGPYDVKVAHVLFEYQQHAVLISPNQYERLYIEQNDKTKGDDFRSTVQLQVRHIHTRHHQYGSTIFIVGALLLLCYVTCWIGFIVLERSL